MTDTIKLLITMYAAACTFYFFVLYETETKENERMRFTWYFLAVLNAMTAIMMGVI